MTRGGIRMRGAMWLVAVAFALGACTATDSAAPKATGAAERPAVQLPRDQGGDEALSGTVRIASVARARLVTDGVVTYRVDNMRDTLLDDLTWGVLFVFPARSNPDIRLPYESEVTSELEFILMPNEQGRVLEARSREFAKRAAQGDLPLSTKLIVRQPPTIPAVARSDAGRGSFVMGGALEIVELSPTDDRFGSATKLWARLENVWSKPITDGLVRVRFVSRDGSDSLPNTEWVPVPPVGPGEQVRVDFDISGIPQEVTRSKPFVIWGRRAPHE